MANKTIADRIVAAYGTGEEAKFHATDATSSGTEYPFTPAGLADYLVGEESFPTVGVAVASLTHSVGTADGTVDDVGVAFDQTTLNNNFKELTAKLDALLTSLRDAGVIAT